MINTTEGIKQIFEQTYDIIYCSIQNVLAIGIKGSKIEDQVSRVLLFYQGDLDLIKCCNEEVFCSLKRIKSPYDQPQASRDYGATYPCKFGKRYEPDTSR